MDTETIKAVAQLGGTVVVVFGFLWYLNIRNGKLEKALSKMAEAMERNTLVLTKVALKHKLIREIDDLIK